MPRPMVEIDDVEVIKETSDALLCIINDEEVWIPKSQIDSEESQILSDGDTGTLVITEWLATEKGLI